MSKRGRGIFGGIAFALVVVLTVFVLGYRLLVKALPKTDGTITLKVLERRVDVYRDPFGVPHIFAEDQIDLFRAAGYVTAQDRLWQMDLNRRAAAGRLAEIFGSSAIESDKFVRTWGFMRTAKAIIASLSSQSLDALRAYAEGVNEFLESNQGKLPLEFSILGYEPDPWRIEDSVAIVRFMGWRLSFSWYVDLVLHELVRVVGPSKAREVFPGFPKTGPIILSSWSKDARSSRWFLESGIALREFFQMHGATLGSNSWVVAGEKSACGKPLLANDPHLQLTTPSIWYEMHLSAKDLDVAGVALPGTPGVLIGHNREIAWGLTNGMVDDVDFYAERLNPENPSQYWTGADWADFEEIYEDIFVKGARPARLTIRHSRNGPVISEIHPVAADSAIVYSMRWTGHEPSDELKALLLVQNAGNWNEFRAALRHFKVPAQNFVFASVDGDIGYQLSGAVPIRSGATGILPHQGWGRVGQWRDHIPFESMPSIHNPPQKFIVAANNKIVDDNYPFYITNLWEPPSRAARITQLLESRDKLSVEDFKSIQNDLTSVLAQEVMPTLLAAVESRLDTTDQNLIKLYRLIKDWDGTEEPESVAASIFHAFFVKLAENTLQDEMGEELYRQYTRLANVPTRVLTALLRNPRSLWFDNVLTPDRESRDEIIVRSLRDAGTLLTERAGEHVRNWIWGELHTLTMKHSLGQRRPLDSLLNLGPFPRGGSTATVNNNQYRFAQPFDAVVGASTRQIVNMCNPAKSLSVITTGQSGQRMSKHYKDQLPLWLAGDYRELDMEELTIRQSAIGHLVLEASEGTN